MNESHLSLSWHSMSNEEVIEQLGTRIQEGLTSEEAQRRLKQYGLNQLTEKPGRSFLQLVIDQLNNFVIILLIVAAVISAVLGEWVDAGAILAIVVLNAVMGVVQESRAEAALAALRKLASPEAQVLRDGRRQSLPAHNLVPGDVIFLEAGNFVPADLRLLETINLRVEEAALTGESVPVQKSAALILDGQAALGDRRNSAFMGTTIAYGRGQGVVVDTGMRTQLGLIADMLQKVEEEETPLQQRLDQLGRILGWGALAICGLVFLVGVGPHLIHGTFSVKLIVDMFMVAVSLAIAAVPEGLPAIVTISLALGMREMVRRHALIRRLASVETLGSATVICSDKTGTLTQNAMTVTHLWVDGADLTVTGTGYETRGEFLLEGEQINLADFPSAETALWIGTLNNDAQIEAGAEGQAARMIGDPTEGAIVVAAAKAGILQASLNESFPRQQEIPFDSVRKRMVTFHRIHDPHGADSSPFQDHENERLYAIAVKGAPDEVLRLCTHIQDLSDHPQQLDDEGRKRVLDANDRMTREALRVLGLAYRVVPTLPDDVQDAGLESGLIFAGLVGMIDPARTEVKPALEEAGQAGIRTIMITGDYPNTARAVAETIGLLRPGHQVLTGAELNSMDDARLEEEVRRTDVFARVSPEHKMRIVDALRANNEVVAMTGDGVNDAPAIKRADIGVAMGITGTDVAKETADMVLTDDNYASIVAAIEQGRIIYSNIRKFVYYLLSCNMAEIAIIFLSTLFTGKSALAAIQLLWLNLVTDGAPALALGTEKGDPDIMQQPPRPPRESIINRYMQIGIVIQTTAITIATLAAYAIGRSSSAHFEFAETMAFTTLSLSELLRAYTARSEYYPLLRIGVFTNKWMNIAVLLSVVMVLAVVYIPFLNTIFSTTPLGWAQWAEITPLIFLPSIAAELAKWLIAPRFLRHTTA